MDKNRMRRLRKLKQNLVIFQLQGSFSYISTTSCPSQLFYSHIFISYLNADLLSLCFGSSMSGKYCQIVSSDDITGNYICRSQT